VRASLGGGRGSGAQTAPDLSLWGILCGMTEPVQPRFCNPLKDNTYRVIDCDTVEVLLDRGWQETKLTALRILGTDAPESTTRQDLLEREAGKLVAKVTEKWMASHGGAMFYASSEVRPKYSGRTIGRIWPEGGLETGNELSAFLLAGGFVRAYYGTKREDWSAEELNPIIAKAKAYLYGSDEATD